MIVLHLDRSPDGAAAFRAERPADDGTAAPLVGDALRDAVRSVVWYPDGLDETPGGALAPSLPNLLMFLSDVRGRRFRRGLFCGDDVLRAVETFRAAARCVAAGRYLPDIDATPGGFRAVWRPLEDGDAFFARCVDGLVRLGGRTPLEAIDRPETADDAFLAALRRDDGALVWPDAEEVRDLMRRLAEWRAPLAVSAAGRAALAFALVPPPSPTGAWRIVLSSAPHTRLEFVALGQAAAVCPVLRGLRGGAVDISRSEAEAFLNGGARALEEAGYAVTRPPGVAGEHVTADADLTPAASAAKDAAPGADARAVAARLTVRVDGERVTERELQFLLDQESTLVFFRNRWIEVDRYVLREALKALRAASAKKLTVREAAAFAFGAARAGRLRIGQVKAHGWLRGLLNELRGEERFAVLPPPDGLKGVLRDYQARGFSWLAFLAKWGFGPCLADDMGLGKTIQTIAFLLHRKETGAAGRPALVVAPVSVTMNWIREFRRFAPGLRVALHQGPARATGERFRRLCARADAVVTGYALLVKDFREFADARFSALILDEAQTVKNPGTQAARAVRALDVPVRVALTGTPLENRVTDIWALEDFLNPGLLGERRAFEETYAEASAAPRLRRLLEPFMLRRLKSDPGIAAELGAKRDVREYCPLSAAQRRRYEDALEAYRRDVTAVGGEPSRGRMLALLTELKLVCDGDGKAERLEALLADVFAAGESCLVFTQYAKVGRWLQARLQEEFGRRFPFLHGALSPAQREAEIAAFNGDPAPSAFILSLKAGGFGLNLTRASHVIHFDRWWNPAVEDQATDRAHRIGQTRTVFVHRFICAGTLEDRIDALLESKRALAGAVVSGGESFLLQMGAREFERTVALA